jgi:LmbE family N-acetylglucosaminyl deacetylase
MVKKKKAAGKSKQDREKVMLIMAHPDDAELSSGGSVAIWVSAGKEVRYVICTNGDKGSKDPDTSPFRLAEIREEEQRNAARILGVKQVTFLRYGDGELENTRAFRNELAMLIREFQPKVIVTHDPWRPYMVHPDHRAVGFATVDAVVVARDHLFVPFWLELGLPPHAPLEIYFTFPSAPDYVIDITSTLEKKLEAIGKHESQMGRFPQWKDLIKAMAARMAEKEKFAYGEAFKRLVLI